MTREELIKNCRYYKGEDKNPYKDDGRWFWWRLESGAVYHGDKKDHDDISPSMFQYIRNKFWLEKLEEYRTTEAECWERARQLYLHGVEQDLVCYR